MYCRPVRRVSAWRWRVLTLAAGILLAGSASVCWARDDNPVRDANGRPTSTTHVTYGFVPNDPYFFPGVPQAWYQGQWYLENAYTPGLDLGVQGPWASSITGQGVVTAVVDDCLQTTHPDLAPNYDAADSWNFVQNNGSPDPVGPSEMHGTSTSGILAARGGNGIGVTGVAPYAQIAGLRVSFGPDQTEQMFVNATLYHSSGANTTIKIESHSYGVADDYFHTAAEADAVALSASYGTIHVFAAGNEGADVNKKQLQNQTSVLTVGAVGPDGRFAYYSNYGACLFATAPSSGAFGVGVMTTDRTGEDGYNEANKINRVDDPLPNPDYTSQFGGTSASAPELAGVLALVKQVQPNLDVRFAKQLLVKTCKRVDLGDQTSWSDGGWRPNAAGNWFNQNYGFGLVDANALVAAATQYKGVTPLQVESTPTVPVGQIVPDGNATGVTRTFTLHSTTPLEELLVTVDANHPYWGDLNIVLTSPSGTVSRLVKGMEGGPGEEGLVSWTFCSNVFWGEDPNGSWKINVADIWSGFEGTWDSFQVTADMGELIPVNVPEPTTMLLMLAGGLAALRRKRRRPCAR